MWLIKLPFRIIALLIMAVVSVFSIFYSIALHISTLAAGLLYLTLLFQHAWALAAIVFGFAVLVFLAILFAKIISLGLETLTGLLSKFIFS